MNKSGFTLIELLVVIAIIGLLATMSVVALNSARDKAMISRRLSDMRQIQTALEIFKDSNGFYPVSSDASCGGWDFGNQVNQLLPGKLSGILDNPPVDISATGCNGYYYYRYSAGYSGCDPNRGGFFVLGIKGSGKTYPTHASWQCPSRDWRGEFEWSVGAFEN